jgi:peptidoglycan/LPS O-acetylase OafA/YrhL
MRARAPVAYRPEIDGLRGIAILSVLLNHMDARILPGGYVGVDVFFVISGFLITTIVRRELKSGRFSFWDFYARRAKRLIPAATAMAVITMVVGYLFFLPRELHLLSKSLVAYGAMLSNVFFYRSSISYWDGQAKPWPLLHTWSLSIEEQFYLAYPCLLWGLARTSLGKQRQVIFALLAASFACSLYQTSVAPRAAFYLLPGRAWELLSGAACALFGPVERGAGATNVLGVVAVGLIGAPMFLYTHETWFPGWAAAMPVMGAAMLLKITESTSNIWQALLGWKPIVAVGRMSYSLYLFHWPMLVFARYLCGGSPETPSVALGYFAALASFAGAWLSYRYVETPWRRRRMSPEVAVALACACNAALLFVGYGIHRREGLPERLPPLAAQYAKGSEDGNPRRAETNLDNDKIKAGERSRLGQGGPLDFVLWGDSHAGALVAVFDHAAKQYGFSGTAYTRNGTPPLIDIDIDNHHFDPEFANTVLARLAKDRVPCVILAGRWLGCLQALSKGNNSAEARGDGLSLLRESLSRTITKLRESGVKQIWLMRQVPTQPCDVPRALALDAWWGRYLPLPKPRAATPSDYEKEMREIDELFELSSAEDVGVIDLATAVFANKTSLLTADGRPMYHDDDHVSASGALTLRHAIEPIFEQMRKSQPEKAAAQ